MMLLVLLSTMSLVMAVQSSTPTSASSLPTLHLHHSLLYSLLQSTGYSDTCVAAALDACFPVSEQYQNSSLIQEAREVLEDISHLVNKLESRPRHCKDLLDSGDNNSGLRVVYPYPGEPQRRVTVYCDHTVDGGGWTVFQRRTNDSMRQDFTRTWIEYKLGFGDLEGEFWLGLDLLHILTSTTLQQLRINLSDYEGEKRWAQYDFFNVDTEENKYRLSVGRYSGDAEDALIASGHHGSSFSTHDRDNDNHSSNCAKAYRGGWWYSACHQANLNGYQHHGNHTSYADGINWRPWRGYHYSLRQTSMMIRPAF